MFKLSFICLNRLTLLALVACVLPATFLSCSKDDDGSKTDPIVGGWSREYLNSDNETFVESYNFYEDGTGFYINNHDVSAQFDYKLNPGTIYGKIWYYYSSKYGSKDDFRWSYKIRGDTLRLTVGVDTKILLRKW